MNRHTDDEVPQHPCLELVSNSEEKLTLLISRRLITMKKIADGDAWTMPATIEDPAVFEEIARALKTRGLPG